MNSPIIVTETFDLTYKGSKVPLMDCPRNILDAPCSVGYGHNYTPRGNHSLFFTYPTHGLRHTGLHFNTGNESKDPNYKPNTEQLRPVEEKITDSNGKLHTLRVLAGNKDRLTLEHSYESDRTWTRRDK